MNKILKENLYFPIDLSSSGSCMIRGNIATNAGGINALKYGSMKDNVIGLEIVSGDGSIMMNLQELETIRGNNLSIKLLVINNNVYSIIRRRHKDLFRKRTIFFF